MNDRIMQLSRAFLYPEGVPGNPHQRYYDVNYRGNSYLILFKLVGFSVYKYIATKISETFYMLRPQQVRVKFLVQSMQSEN